MIGRPIAIGLGLSIYVAERNTGPYKNLFLTFSEHPEFVELKGNTLREKVACVRSIVANTDLEAGMDLILKVAIENGVSQEELPKYLIVISDMHFDSANDNSKYNSFGEVVRVKKTFHQSMSQKFNRAGYEMPTIIYWNVDERAPAVQAKADDSGVILVSGASTSTFRDIINNMSGKTPYDFMIEVLNSEQYAVVQI
jgi:predicted PilT family ATPase